MIFKTMQEAIAWVVLHYDVLKGFSLKQVPDGFELTTDKEDVDGNRISSERH